MPMYSVRCATSTDARGDKITNVEKNKLISKLFTAYYPQAKSRTHEIGIEACDKMGGKNLGHYVKRV